MTQVHRWQALDLALPSPTGPGVPRQLSPGPGEPLPMWFAAHRFTFRPVVDSPSELAEQLTSWAADVRAEPRAADEDSGAYVFVPSRDTEMFPPLLRHGFVPYVIVAARTVARPVAGGDVRRAGPGDLDALTELVLEQTRSELDFGTAVDRPDAASRLRADVAELLVAPEPWVWVASEGSQVVGAVTAERPDSTGWLAPFTDLRPVAYLRMARVEPGARAAGIGTALVAAAHQAFDAAGVSCALLHYSLLNPRSGPFWHRMGYRPLWTCWKATPAARMRG